MSGSESKSFQVGDSVEFLYFDTWHPAKIEQVVMHDGQPGHYEVSHDKLQSPDGTKEALAGTHPFVLPEQIRLPKENNKCVRTHKVGDAVEFLWFDEWHPAKIEQINTEGNTTSYAVSHDDLKSSDGTQETMGGTLYYVSPAKLRPRQKNADVGWWPGFGPSDEAKAVFDAASLRLDDLLAWGVKDKLPHRARTLEDVMRFRDEWKRGKAELPHLSGFKSDVISLENEAAEKGFKKKPGEIPRIDVENVSAATQAAASVAAAQKELGAIVHDAASETRTSLLSGFFGMLDAIPAAYKIGVGVGLFGLGAVYAASAGKRR